MMAKCRWSWGRAEEGKRKSRLDEEYGLRKRFLGLRTKGPLKLRLEGYVSQDILSNRLQHCY